MRVIFNTDLFKYFEFLSKEDITKALKLIDLFAQKNSYELNLEIDIKNLEFMLTNGNNVLQLNKELIKLFDKNKETVAKCRAKKKQTIGTGQNRNKSDDEAIKLKRQPKNEEAKQHVIDPKKHDYKLIVENYNSVIREANAVAPQIEKVSATVIKKIDSLYSICKDLLPKEVNIEDFYDMYFNELMNDKQNVEGWAWDKATNGWFKPNFDYFMRSKTFENTLEKAKNRK